MGENTKRKRRKNEKITLKERKQDMLEYIEYNLNDNKYYRVIVYDDNTIERTEIKEN